MLDAETARTLLQESGLNAAAAQLDSVIEHALHSECTYAQFLVELLTAERAERRRRSQEVLFRFSHLPSRKRLDEFDFNYQPSIDRKQINELSSLSFAGRAENIILLGPPGVGKTHLAIGLAVKAVEAGMKVYYSTLSGLIEDLHKANEHGRFSQRWKTYTRPSVLIIDEIGYSQLSRREAEMLFRLVSERYERGSIIITSNKHFTEWGELLSDHVLATALLDRLLHHAYVINIRGNTYRLKDRLKGGTPASIHHNSPEAENSTNIPSS